MIFKGFMILLAIYCSENDEMSGKDISKTTNNQDNSNVPNPLVENSVSEGSKPSEQEMKLPESSVKTKSGESSKPSEQEMKLPESSVKSKSGESSKPSEQEMKLPEFSVKSKSGESSPHPKQEIKMRESVIDGPNFKQQIKVGSFTFSSRNKNDFRKFIEETKNAAKLFEDTRMNNLYGNQTPAIESNEHEKQPNNEIQKSGENIDGFQINTHETEYFDENGNPIKERTTELTKQL